jgi:hypothetical protein
MPLITPRDLLAPAGEPLALEVELERRLLPFLDPAIEAVEIEVDGAGRAVVGPGGVAAVPLGALAPGTYRYRVRWRSAQAEALIRVVPRDVPILITDIDQTLADVSALGFVLLPNRSIRPLRGAREALEEIAGRMEIAYLTARDHIFSAKTKAWLRQNGFPEAPLYLRRGTRFWTVGAQAHKISVLREIRLRFPNIRWGVGDLPGDAHAYAAHRIPAILLGNHPVDGLPPGTVCAPCWSDIRNLIKPDKAGSYAGKGNGPI